MSILNNEIKLKHINFLYNEIKKIEALKLKNLKISFLSSGQCNYLYLLESIDSITNNKLKYLAKICTWEQNEVWQIKKAEFEILKLIEPLSISPKAYYYNLGDNPLNLHWNIVEYIEGEMLLELTNDQIIQLASILNKLHSTTQSKFYGDKFPPTLQNNYISSVFEDLDNKIESKAYQALKNKFNQINWSNIHNFCLIHNDLKEYNMIIQPNNRIKLIDWEYAYYDIPENDIARLFVENNLNESRASLFLKHYLSSDKINFDTERLKVLIDVYSFFEIHKKKVPPITNS